MALRNNLEIMLQRGQDSPLLRFSLGSECLKDGDLVAAVDHLRQAVQLNAGYSAAWKVLGQAYSRTGASERAVEAYRQGIAAATAQGDMQAAREMTVFLKRLAKDRGVQP